MQKQDTGCARLVEKQTWRSGALRVISRQFTLQANLSTTARSVERPLIARTASRHIRLDRTVLIPKYFNFSKSEYLSMSYLNPKFDFNQAPVPESCSDLNFWQASPWPSHFLDRDTRLEEYIVRVAETGQWMCKDCGKTTAKKCNILNHVEAIHFAGQFAYKCQICGKTFKSKNSFSVHTSTLHRINPWWCNWRPIFCCLLP